MQHQERADKPILSVESGGPADIALMASALVRWLCVTGFSRVCPSIFFSIGSAWNRRTYLKKSTTGTLDGGARTASASGSEHGGVIGIEMIGIGVPAGSCVCLERYRSDIPGVVQHPKYRQFRLVNFIKHNIGRGTRPTANRTTQLRPGPPHQRL